MGPYSQCQHPGGKNRNACDAAIGGFQPDKWLGTHPAGHLFDGLTYLLQAAQEWQCQRDLGIRLSGYQVQVYAMDSVFLRARSLFEFFTGTGSNYCHAQCFFGLNSQLSYDRYENSSWKNVLHYGSIHIQNRDTSVQLKGYNDDSLKDLNDMPVDFAKGILEVWKDFEAKLPASDSASRQMAQACREQAILAARNVFDSVAQRAAEYNGKAGSAMTKLF